MPAKNMLRMVGDNLFVLVHTAQSPTDGEWDSYLTDLARFRAKVDLIATLVFTKGGGPNTRQRAQLHKLLAERPTRVSVVTGAVIPRAIVSALSWFNPSIR